jgi:hypothetical protein
LPKWTVVSEDVANCGGGGGGNQKNSKTFMFPKKRLLFF